MKQGTLKASALGQPRGMGWGRRWEWGSGQGNTCTPVADSCQLWQKPQQYCKVISLQLKLIIFLKNAKIVASSPISSWQIEGEKVETVTDFIILGSKITVDSDYSHEIACSLEGKL